MDLFFVVFHTLPRVTLFVWFFVIGGSYKVLKLKRSRNGYKKLKRSLTLFDRLSKRKFVQLSITAKEYQKYFCFMTYAGYFLLLALLTIWIVSIFHGEFKTMFKWYMYLKCYLLELPAFIFTMFNMKRPKSGIGMDWRFVEK